MTISISENNFGLAHYSLVRSLLRQGTQIPTDYDKPGDLLSLDAPMAIEVYNPWSPPVFSKCMWSSWEGAFEYAAEVVDGINDQKGELGYTYHARMKDQWPGVLAELKRNGATRRAQCITWQPETDLGGAYPPCLQRIWSRVVNGKLNMHTHWRSRDALKAWGLNVFAFAHLHKKWAGQMGIGVGVYREFIDSCHIYGKDIDIATRLVNKRVSWQVSLAEIQNKTGWPSPLSIEEGIEDGTI